MCSPFLPFAMCFNNNIKAEVYTDFAVEVASVLCKTNVLILGIPLKSEAYIS